MDTKDWHRTANAAPESVAMITDLDAHLVLVTGGHYVSSAGGRTSCFHGVTTPFVGSAVPRHVRPTGRA